MLKADAYLDHNLFGSAELAATRDGFGRALLELGEQNPNVVALTGDLLESTRMQDFARKYPERFVECGIAEQNMLGVAAGLALAGKIPFVSSYATFSPGRNWDQLRVSVCYSKANVKIAGAHTGLTVGPDGATHQGLEDLAITRVLPGLVVMAPCDFEETRKCTQAAAAYPGPVYFRFGREKTPVITTSDTPFEIGKAYTCYEGDEITIAACGPLLHRALLAARALEKDGVSAEIINFHTLKPFDHAALEASVRKTGCCVTVEEHQITGGLAGAVAESLATHFPVPCSFVGMPDSFGESGAPDELLKKYGMTTERIIAAAKNVIVKKESAFQAKAEI